MMYPFCMKLPKDWEGAWRSPSQDSFWRAVGCGAKILGNVEIGEGARVGASSVVLKDVPAYVSVAGVPAKEIGVVHDAVPALGMDHNLLEVKEYEGGGGI